MFKKAKVDGKIVDVVTLDEFCKSPTTNFPANYTAIEAKGMIYPIRGKNDTRPGMYTNGTICKFIKPPLDDQEEYLAKNAIDFNNLTSIKEVINAQNEVKNLERVVLTTVDNIFVPNIGENDAPEMVVLKEAIIAKNLDITKYEPRFGPSYPNDVRLLTKASISMVKLKSTCAALGIKATLILEDESPDVPNPIGRQLFAELTLGGDDEE